MPFPKNKILPNNEDALKAVRGKTIKKLEFSPLFFCEFFEGMEVLQLQGQNSKEYLYGLYWSGKLVGHCYFGELYSQKEVTALIKKYMPPTYDELHEYYKNFGDEIWYYKHSSTAYAWIYEQVLQKVE